MKISLFLINSFKTAFWLNLLLFIIMIVVLSFNFVKIPEMTSQGPFVVFIFDFISNAIWLISTLFMIFTYFKLSYFGALFHFITSIILWTLKLIELILIVSLINNSDNEKVLIMGDKTANLIGVSIDVVIILPLTVLAYFVKQYITQILTIKDV